MLCERISMAVPKFEDLTPALSSNGLNAIESFGFHHTTPVQAATIPLFLSHKVDAGISLYS